MFLDDKLNFNIHLKQKMKKLNKGVGVLKKLQHILLKKTLLTIHKSFIWLHFDYRDLIYDQPNNGSFIEKCSYNRSIWFEPWLCSLHIYTAFDKTNLGRKKSLRAASKSATQFWPRVIPDRLFYPFYQQIREIVMKLSMASLSKGWMWSKISGKCYL